MQQVIVDLYIPVDEYIKRYKAVDAIVYANSRDGRSVQFPANILQPYVTHSGIKGCFRISFNQAGKFCLIEQL